WKHTKMDLSGKQWVTVHSCRVYLFYRKKVDGKLGYVDERTTFKKNGGEHADKKYVTIDASGGCDVKLGPGAMYFCYFAGKELTPAEVAALRGKRRVLLLPVIAKEEIHIQQSFFWWIALLQHVEAEVKDRWDVLTKVRKLYYHQGNWDDLIDRKSV